MKLNTVLIRKCKVLNLLSVLFFISSNVTSTESAEPRNFFDPQMCTSNHRINDCSDQFFSNRGSCMIYKTEDCKNNNFPPWNLPPVKKLTQEANLDFTVTILPYDFSVYGNSKIASEVLPISAVNILLTSFNRNISGYSIIMTDDVRSRNACRIIDFRNVQKKFDIPFTFFFDCFQKLREDTWKDVTLSFTAYPLNTELSYHVFIPSVSNSSSLCDWEPLVMLFKGSLRERHVQVKFSNVSKDMKFLFFLVTLMDSSDAIIDSRKIASTVKNDMVSSEFHNVEDGYYSVSIDILLDERSCTVYRSGLFLVGEDKDLSPVIFTVLLLTVVLSGVLILYVARMSLARALSYANSAPSSGPTLLFVYFHKQPEHEFLVKYTDYLEKHFRVTAYTLYKRDENPRNRLDKIFRESDVIVYVLSEGFFKNFDIEDASIIPDSCYVEQFSEIKALIHNSRLGSKKICTVCFPYSGVQHLPESLEKKDFFKLLDQQEDFLHFIFNCSVKCWLLNWLCCIKYHRRFKLSDIKKNGEQLRKELKNIKESYANNASNKVVNKDGIQNTEGNICQFNQKSPAESARRDLNHAAETEILSMHSINNILEEEVSDVNGKQSDFSTESMYVNCENASQYVETAEYEAIVQQKKEKIWEMLSKVQNCEKYQWD